MKKDLRIVFMGTPEFSVPSLRILVDNSCNVVAVITAADKPRGRGRKVQYSPVKEFAIEHDIPVLQPSNLKDPGFVEKLRSYKANLQVVVAFRMLPEVVWNMPEIGTFNLHASLLPDYRGAAPMNWVIINGEDETGLTTFFLKHEIDTGNIIFQEKEPIYRDDTAGTLHDRLMYKGADLVFKTVQAIQKDDYPQIRQNDEKSKHRAPKIFKEDCEIDWSLPSEKIYNFVRGLSPYPTAWTTLNRKLLKIFACEIINTGKNSTSEKINTDNKTYLHFKSGDGWIALKTVQLEGKKKMSIDEFLRGFEI